MGDPIDFDGIEDSFDEACNDYVADVVDEHVDEDDSNSASEHKDGKRGDAIDGKYQGIPTDEGTRHGGCGGALRRRRTIEGGSPRN